MPPRLCATKIKGRVAACLCRRLMVSDARRPLPISLIKSGVSPWTRAAYPNVKIRASGTSWGSRSFGQKIPEVAQVLVEPPWSPWTNTMLQRSSVDELLSISWALLYYRLRRFVKRKETKTRLLELCPYLSHSKSLGLVGFDDNGGKANDGSGELPLMALGNLARSSIDCSLAEARQADVAGLCQPRLPIRLKHKYLR